MLLLLLAVPVGVVIGLSLGALGGGGSILTVPALVYLLSQGAHGATTASLVIVGLTSLAGTFAHARAGRVRVTKGLVFGALGVAGSFVGARLSAGVNSDVLLSAFAGLVLVAAGAMALRLARPPGGKSGTAGSSSSPPAEVGSPVMVASSGWPLAGRARGTAALGEEGEWGPSAVAGASAGPPAPVMLLAREGNQGASAPLALARPKWEAPAQLANIGRVVAAASVVGLLTGFFGVGGGFIVVPALVLTLGFEMPEAVGTSLLVIAVNTAAALLARLGTQADVNWTLVAVFLAAAIAGSVAGNRVASVVRPGRLALAFTFLLVAVAIYTGARSIPHLL